MDFALVGRLSMGEEVQLTEMLPIHLGRPVTCCLQRIASCIWLPALGFLLTIISICSLLLLSFKYAITPEI